MQNQIKNFILEKKTDQSTQNKLDVCVKWKVGTCAAIVNINEMKQSEFNGLFC